MKQWSDGDIIKRTSYSGGEWVCVLVKVYERYATTLTIYPEAQKGVDYSIVVEGKTIMHCDPGKLTYAKEVDLAEAKLIRCMTDKEYLRLLRKIGETLGIPTLKNPSDEDEEGEKTDYKAECEALKAKVDALITEKQGLQVELAKAHTAIDNAETQIAAISQKATMAESYQTEKINFNMKLSAVTAERDVYKELYMKLLSAMSGMPQVLSTGTTYPGTPLA